MEDTLREMGNLIKGSELGVLILVLMEDTLRVTTSAKRVNSLTVLILVLMEDTLRGGCCKWSGISQCLNPCFNGRYSQSMV